MEAKKIIEFVNLNVFARKYYAMNSLFKLGRNISILNVKNNVFQICIKIQRYCPVLSRID